MAEIRRSVIFREPTTSESGRLDLKAKASNLVVVKKKDDESVYSNDQSGFNNDNTSVNSNANNNDNNVNNDNNDNNVNNVNNVNKNQEDDSVTAESIASLSFNDGLSISPNFPHQFPEKRTKPTVVTELQACRIMEAALLKQVPLSFSKINLLRLKLQLFRNAKEKLDVINETIAACAAIHICKSMQHRNPAGCPVCGVIHKGGKMNTQLYVKSKHRETGAFTLILLSEEEENLQREKIEQEEVLSEAEDEYVKLHAALHYKFLSGVQAWFCAHLARRRAEVVDPKLVVSDWYFRIRRLARLKRVVDSVDIQTIQNIVGVNVDDEELSVEGSIGSLSLGSKFDELLYTFSDAKKELKEYVAKRVIINQLNTEKIAKKFAKKLKLATAKTRNLKARHEEAVRQKNLLMHEKMKKLRNQKILVYTRKVVEIMKHEHKQWVCHRPSCDQRQFLSKDRYLVHMSIHAAQDKVRDDRTRVLTRIGDMRELKALEFLDRVEASKSAADKAPLFDSSNYSAPWEWTKTPHLRSLFADSYHPTLFLEVVSKKADIDIPSKIPLDHEIVRFGTMKEACGFSTGVLSGAAKQENKLSKIHCLIYVPMGSSPDSLPTIVDNHSKYGTYLVDEQGARKCPTRVTCGYPLIPGNLLCIAVKQKGEDILQPHEAGEALVVYRVACFEQVKKFEDDNEDVF